MNLRPDSLLRDSFIPCVLWGIGQHSCELTRFLQEGPSGFPSNERVKYILEVTLKILRKIYLC